MIELPIRRPRLLVLYAWMVVLGWTGIVIIVTSLLLAMIFGVPVWGVYGLLLLPVSLAATLPMAPFLRCPHCRRCVTIQMTRHVHPASLINGASPGWASVIVRVLRSRRFVCMHCGERVAVDG